MADTEEIVTDAIVVHEAELAHAKTRVSRKSLPDNRTGSKDRESDEDGEGLHVKKKKQTNAVKGFQRVVDDELIKEEPNFDVVRHYLEFDVSLLFVDPEGGATVLHRAALAGATDIAKAALKQGCDINSKTLMGRTPLHCALENNKPTVVDLLMQRNADPNAVTLGGMTPLHTGARAGSREAIEVLIKYKECLIDIENAERQTAIMLSKDPEIRKILEEKEVQMFESALGSDSGTKNAEKPKVPKRGSVLGQRKSLLNHCVEKKPERNYLDEKSS